MTTLHLVHNRERKQPVVWDTYPSWAQFAWLFLLSGLSALRAALLFRFGVSGWEMWMAGAGMLIACAVALRRWAHYELTPERITVRNGYTGREIESIALGDVREVTIQGGTVADFFGIGTLVIHSRTTDRLLSLRGVSDPVAIKTRIEALVFRRNRVTTDSYPAPA